MRRLWFNIRSIFWWLILAADKSKSEENVMSLDELIVQANEAKEAHTAAKLATMNVEAAESALRDAGDHLDDVRLAEIAAYQKATDELAEANDALLAYVNALSAPAAT